jgi:hypothetical protein
MLQMYNIDCHITKGQILDSIIYLNIFANVISDISKKMQGIILKIFRK